LPGQWPGPDTQSLPVPGRGWHGDAGALGRREWHERTARSSAGREEKLRLPQPGPVSPGPQPQPHRGGAVGQRGGRSQAPCSGRCRLPSSPCGPSSSHLLCLKVPESPPGCEGPGAGQERGQGHKPNPRPCLGCSCPGSAGLGHCTPIPRPLRTACAPRLPRATLPCPSSGARDPGWGCRDPAQWQGDCPLLPRGQPLARGCRAQDKGVVRAGGGPQRHTCMSASSSCLRRRMFSSSWHSSGVRSLGTEQRHGQVSTRGHGNRPRQAPGTGSAPSWQPTARQELGWGAAGCPELPGGRAVPPAPHSGQVPPPARAECEARASPGRAGAAAGEPGTVGSC